jgi:hypothetical protein
MIAIVGVHAFVDESSRASYHLVAAIVEPAHLAGGRALLRALRLPGERRLHFESGGNARLSRILSALRDVEASAWVYVRPGQVRGRSRGRRGVPRCGAERAWRITIGDRKPG